jgi:ABC-type thiamin/hydroxymethylpyrimidine transport system permease subunit
MSNIRLNWVAILVAGIASFIFEALWYSIFMNEWLAGIGRTREWLMTTGVSPALQYGVAIVCAIIASAVLSIVIQATGEHTLRRGVICGALVWLGFVATSWATEYIFEVRSLQIFAVNAGFWFFDLMLIGAIVGVWKKKSTVPALP